MLALIIGVVGTFDLEAQFRRKDIYTFSGGSGGERHRLRQLIIQYLTTHPSNPIQQHVNVIAPLPVGVHCKTGTFATWHRQYLEGLEAWLMTQPDGPKFVPLPKWDPTTPVPDEFFNGLISPGNAVVGGSISNQNPNNVGTYNFSRFLNSSTVCNYSAGSIQRFCMGGGWFTSYGTAFDNFASDLEWEHNPVHGAIGGIMNAGNSPAAAIFWLWHAYVDDLYQNYLCNCTGNYPAKDLYIKDNDADVGDEPNLTTGLYYQSPEIWVRQNQDVQVGGHYSLENDPNRHENAEYKTVGNNYVYVRVRNKGCLATVAQEVRLRVYWSKAQASNWYWPNDWTNTPPQTPKRGDEITNPSVALWVPPLQPGESWVAEIPWHAPNPADYPNDSYHFCLLARLVSTSDPMAQTEGTDVNYNTRENNNVAWKNVTVRNDDPFNIVGPGKHPWNTVAIRGTELATADIRIGFDYPADYGVYATIDLREELYAAWERGGRKGYGITRVEETYLRIDRPGAYIEGLQLSPDQIYTLGVRPYVEYGPGYKGTILNYGDRVNFNVTQYRRGSDADGYVATGGNNYEIRLVQSEQTKCGELIGDQYDIKDATCPNAEDGAIILRLPAEYEYFWSNGVHKPENLNLAPGTYWVVVRTPDNCVERREFVVGDRSNLAIDISSEYPTCRYANGSASVEVTGGREPYAYQWYLDGKPIKGATKPSLSEMGFGTYTVTATDANGCQITDGVTFVDGFMQISLNFVVTDASSPDAKDGAINLSIGDGMAPYTFQWSNGATTEDLSGLAPGEYSVTVIDHMGCAASGTATVGIASSKNVQSVDGTKGDLSVLSIIPNPATDLAEVQYTLRYATNVTVRIYDELGKLVTSHDQGVKPAGVNSAWLVTSDLPAGRYQCRLLYKGGVSSVPFVVVR